MMTRTKLISFLLLLLLGVIWGTGYSIARFAMVSGVSPLGYSFWQSLGPAILIGLLASTVQLRSPSNTNTTQYHSHGMSFSIPYLRYYFFCGLLGIVIPNTNIYFSASHLPAGLLAVIVNTVPIIAYPLALLCRIESFNAIRFLGVVCAFFGLMLLVIPTASLPSREMIPWVISSLLTPLSFAACAIYIALYRPEKGDSLSLAAGTLIASSFILILPIILTHHFYLFHFPLTIADKVILLEIVLSSVGYVLLFQLIKMAGPIYYTLVNAVVALTGLIWGYFIFSETLNIWTTSSVVLILIALLLVTQRQNSMLK